MLGFQGPAQPSRRRVAKSLLLAFHNVARKNDDEELCSELEQITFGWAALPCCSHMMHRTHSAIYAASVIGARMSETQPEARDSNCAEVNGPKPLAHPCPCCRGRMVIIETFERGCSPRTRPAASTAVIIDTS